MNILKSEAVVKEREFYKSHNWRRISDHVQGAQTGA